MHIIEEFGGSLPRSEVMRKVADRGTFSEAELALSGKGAPRWQGGLHWQSVDVARAGWLKKDDGIWSVTSDGRKALDLPVEEFFRQSRDLYRAWLTARKTKAGPVPNTPRDEDLQELRLALEERAGRVWWVNQGTSYIGERDGGFIWAPLKSQTGRELGHHTDVSRIGDGDLLIHYADSALHAVGIAQGTASVDRYPGQDDPTPGYLLHVEYHPFIEAITIEFIPKSIRTPQAGPFTRDKYVKQGYVFAVNDEFVNELLNVLGAGRRVAPSYAEPTFDSIRQAIAKEGLHITNDVLFRYHVSLRTRRFVILSGLSGSGKTWLAQAYARAVNAELAVVPVAPNWTTNEDLLGYFNPVAESYVDTQFSRFLREAAAAYKTAVEQGDSPVPFHVVLDEMNLARVEYYFARFLSALELAQRPVSKADASVPIELSNSEFVSLTPNLFFVGTVNIDETTHSFADKVYDRAQLIEVTVDRGQLAEHIADEPFAPTLLAVWDALRDVAPFAYRVIDDIRSYVAEAGQLGYDWHAALDQQILQKILTKLRGTDPRIGPALDQLLTTLPHDFVLSRQKVEQIASGFRQHGFATYF